MTPSISKKTTQGQYTRLMSSRHIQLCLAVLFAIASSGELVLAQGQGMASPSPTPKQSSASPAVSPSPTPQKWLYHGVTFFDIQMDLQGFPQLEVNSSEAAIWSNITSEHVETYWNQREYADFNVTYVETSLHSVLGDINMGEMNTTGMVYNQLINYALTGNMLDSPLANGSELDLFLLPFETDSQRYIDALHREFNMSNSLVWRGIYVTSTQSPTPSPTEYQGGSLTSGQIAAIAVCSAQFYALVIILLLREHRRRRPKKDEGGEEMQECAPDNQRTTAVQATTAEDSVPQDDYDASASYEPSYEAGDSVEYPYRYGESDDSVEPAYRYDVGSMEATYGESDSLDAAYQYDAGESLEAASYGEGEYSLDAATNEEGDYSLDDATYGEGDYSLDAPYSETYASVAPPPEADVASDSEHDPSLIYI